MVSDALRRLARQRCAIVLAAHEVPDLLELADEAVWMTAGATHGLGRPQAAAAHEQFRRDYFGPAARAEPRAVPDLTPPAAPAPAARPSSS